MQLPRRVNHYSVGFYEKAAGSGKTMAYFGVNATETSLRAAQPGQDLDRLIETGLRDLPEGAPVVVLVHGYKFDPDVPEGHPVPAAIDPHRSLFAFRPARRSWKVRSWPRGLGFRPQGRAEGLCIGFAWPARAAHLPSLLTTGRTGFAAVYDRAAVIGARLAELIARFQARAPGRPIDVLAHSLGARVALSALRHLDVAPGRVILLGAAEFDARVHECLAAMPARRRSGPGPEIYNVTARANDFYDTMFETFAPRRGWGERAVGLGLRDAPPFWLDLQLDRAEVTERINARGIRLTPATVRLCHWSFYTRGGAFDVYRAILRRRPGWGVAELAAEPCFAGQEPRWSLIAPPVPARLPRLPALRAGLGRA